MEIVHFQLPHPFTPFLQPTFYLSNSITRFSLAAINSRRLDWRPNISKTSIYTHTNTYIQKSSILIFIFIDRERGESRETERLFRRRIVRRKQGETLGISRGRWGGEAGRSSKTATELTRTRSGDSRSDWSSSRPCLSTWRTTNSYWTITGVNGRWRTRYSASSLGTTKPSIYGREYCFPSIRS